MRKCVRDSIGIWVILILGLSNCFNSAGQAGNIKNDCFWDTVDGKPIYSQGGGIFVFSDPESGTEKYYWYGAHYKEAELYRNDPTFKKDDLHFIAVTCYTSSDLVNWQFEQNALEKAEVDANYEGTRWMGRLGVAYVKELNKYAMFIQHSMGVLIALADKPAGPFKWHRRLVMTERIGTPNTGDQTVFTDPDTGKSYLIYSYGRGRHKIYISEIGVKNEKVDLLDCTQIYRNTGREGNCMVKYKGKYYVFASNLYGWDSSLAYYMVSDHIRGPYLPTNNMLIIPGAMDDYAHVTQTGFLVNVKGTKEETVIYCGDRWANFAGNGLGYNQWMPLSFDGDTPFLNSLNSWNFNEKTGEWWVAKDNNYVKNGSFEADRKLMPSPKKPIQEQLKGWVSKVYQGNIIAVNDKESPKINSLNTEEDRQVVIGEKSLNISDKVAFKRKVYQVIESTPYVTLNDVRYNMTAKVKTNGVFGILKMYAESGGKERNIELSDEALTWMTVRLENIKVKNGKVEIGFYAEGEANSNCQIDDVTFVKAQ